MPHYDSVVYIGHDPFLKGHSAIGAFDGSTLKVQVSEIEHPWAYGWHETPQSDWLPRSRIFDASLVISWTNDRWAICDFGFEVFSVFCDGQWRGTFSDYDDAVSKVAQS